MVSQEHLYKTVGREIKLKKVHFCITFSIGEKSLKKV